MEMFKKITFVRFCFASARFVLPGDLGLPTEKLICLYKECIEMAKHFNDMGTMMNCCQPFVLYSNSIGRHADSLRCLKEILPSVVIPSYELIVHECLSALTYEDLKEYELLVHKFLSLTYEELKEYENVVLHARKWIEIAENVGDKENEIHGHKVLGDALFSLACYDDVLDCGKKCLAIAQETGSREGKIIAYHIIVLAHTYMEKYDETILYAQELLDCAIKTNGQKYVIINAYIALAQAHSALKHYQDAIKFLGKSIELAKEIKDRSREAKAYLLKGGIYNNLSDYDNAVIYGKKCIELAKTIGDTQTEADAYRLLGHVYSSLGKYEDAISYCNKCIHLDKEDKGLDVQAYFTLGQVNDSLKKYDEAIQNYKQCIAIVESIGREKEKAVNACLFLGYIYARLEQYNDAVYYYKKCIDIANSIGREKKAALAACAFLGHRYKILKQYKDAVYYSKKCIDIAQETSERKMEVHGYDLLAQACLCFDKYDDAASSIDEGIAIATQLGDKETEEKFKVHRSILYGCVGLLDESNICDQPASAQVKKLFEARTCSEDDLLKDLDKAVNAGDTGEKYWALYRICVFYHSKENYPKAINCLEQMKEMDRNKNLFCLTGSGTMYELMGQKDMALRCFKEGLSAAESCSNKRQLSIFYYEFGKLLFLSNKELNLAEKYLREAIRYFEAIFTALGSRDDLKISIFDQYIDSYKLLAALLMNCNRIEEEVLVLDRCRARALKDLMMANFGMKQEGSDDEHLEYSDVLSLVSTNGFSISYYALCYDHLLKFFLGEEIDFFVSAFAEQKCVDTLFDEMGVRDVVNCEDRSLDKEQDIQEEQKRSKEEYEALNQSTASLLNVESKRGESNEKSAEPKESTLEILFDILDCDKIVSSKQGEVVIIPEGPLYKVPFPALRDPRTGKYLSQTKRIRLAPSLAILKHFEDFPMDKTSNAEPLVIGDPLVGKVMMDGEERDDIERLPGALDEATAIARMLGVRPLVAADATKPAILERLQQGVSIVHIAAHGSLTKGKIALAPSPEIRATKIPDEEDYMLTMADVQQAQVRAQLVVLSCCQSGRGEIRAEGVVGMCRAFLASGARAVVASLWAINDQATLEFMQNFYLSLKEGKSASESLQEAMEEMRKTSYNSEPKYWAPFFLMGDDVTLNLWFCE